MYAERDIKHETARFFVLAVGEKGFQVLRKGPTCSTVVARIGNGAAPNLGLTRAIAECERRESIPC